jgi:hypothetical protein
LALRRFSQISGQDGLWGVRVGILFQQSHQRYLGYSVAILPDALPRVVSCEMLDAGNYGGTRVVQDDTAAEVPRVSLSRRTLSEVIALTSTIEYRFKLQGREDNLIRKPSHSKTITAGNVLPIFLRCILLSSTVPAMSKPGRQSNPTLASSCPLWQHLFYWIR